jgi:RNA polymerase sigma factor (sigma-70 family)
MSSRRDQFFASLFDRQRMRKRYPHRDTAFSAYMSDLGVLPPVPTAAQEATLLAQVANGDSSAVLQLAEANLRLVIAIAANYQGRGLPMLDLIQEGNLGLLEAIKHYDSSKANKAKRLSTYAKYWIISSIQRALAGHGTLVHAPYRTGERLQVLREAIVVFEDQQGIEPTAAILAERLGWPFDEVMELLTLMQKPLSLSQMEGEDETLAERIVAPPVFLSNDITSPSLLADVRAMIGAVLTPKERLVIEHRFGLTEDGIVYEHREIAAICFQRVGPRADESIRQLEKRALAKLRLAFDGKEG